MNWFELGAQLFEAFVAIFTQHAPNAQSSQIAKAAGAGVAATVAAMHQSGMLPATPPANTTPKPK